MAPRKRKTTSTAPEPSPQDAPATPPDVTCDVEPADGPDVFDDVLAARAAGEGGSTLAESAPVGRHAGEPQPGAAEPRAYQPDPFPLLSVAVGEGADAPRVRLFRNRRMNQVAVGFDQKPPDEVRQRLRDEGYKWRDAEGVWTRQLGEERAAGQLAAERLVAEIADAVRAGAGLAPVGRAEGR